MERALLNGNCGVALLGEDIQSGEAEFVEIRLSRRDGPDEKRIACTRAYRKLKDRLPDRVFSYVMQAPGSGEWWRQ